MSIFLGDSGTKLILECGTTISTATKREVRYMKPSGARGTWTGGQETTTSISYVTLAGDIDEVGTWKFQAYVEILGQKLYGTVTTIKVIRPI